MPGRCWSVGSFVGQISRRRARAGGRISATCRGRVGDEQHLGGALVAQDEYSLYDAAGVTGEPLPLRSAVDLHGPAHRRLGVGEVVDFRSDVEVGADAAELVVPEPEDGAEVRVEAGVADRAPERAPVGQAEHDDELR